MHIRRYLVPQLGRIKLADLAGEDIEAAITATRIRKANRELSPGSRQRIYATLRSSLRAAAKCKRITSSPTEVELGGARRQTDPNPWSEAELGAFFDHEAVAGHRFYAPLHVAAYTAMRRGELAGIRWSDVDLNAGELTVRRQRVVVGHRLEAGPPKSARGRRRVPLDPSTVAVLRTWKARKAGERLARGPDWTVSGYVFTDESGAPLHPERFGRGCTSWCAGRRGRRRLCPMEGRGRMSEPVTPTLGAEREEMINGLLEALDAIDAARPPWRDPGHQPARHLFETASH